MERDLIEAMRANPIAKLLTQIEQNTRSERTAVLYKTRKELGADKVKVKLRSNIYAITDIDNVKQEFTANLTIRARWQEPLLKDTPETAEIDWDDQWNPRLELDNAVAIKNFDRKYELKHPKSDRGDNIPYVYLTMNISATFKEMFELDEFPIDYQALNIWIISEWTFEQVELVKDDESVDRLTLCTFTESKEWDLYPQLIGEPVGKPREASEEADDEDSPEQFPLYTVTVQVKRRHQFYMWNHVFFMFTLFLIALSTFAIPFTDVGSRIIGTVLILLCALVYRLHMQPSLPVVSYWTALDKFNMAILLCHILILMEHAIIGTIAQSPTADVVTQAGQADYACLAAIVCIMLTILCYFVAFFLQTTWKRDKFLEEETNNFIETNKEILKRQRRGQQEDRWEYEAASPDPMNRCVHPMNGETHHNPAVREEVVRRSGRGQEALLPPLPPSPRGNHVANRRMIREDYINPREATHEMKIAMPLAVLKNSGERSRSTSRSRANGRRGRNRVASGQSQTETSDEE